MPAAALVSAGLSYCPFWMNWLGRQDCPHPSGSVILGLGSDFASWLGRQEFNLTDP
jgi:hypothetical protein